MPWRHRRRLRTSAGALIVILMVTAVCVGMLAWAGVVLDVHFFPGG